jgi:hypothetical protein
MRRMLGLVAIANEAGLRCEYSLTNGDLKWIAVIIAFNIYVQAKTGRSRTIQ